LGERASGKAGENNGLSWDDVLEYAEDFDLELFDVIPLEDSATDAAQSGADIFEREEGLSGAGKSDGADEECSLEKDAAACLWQAKKSWGTDGSGRFTERGQVWFREALCD
jgi:hypothetical protein